MLNRVVLMGRLVADPELKTTTSGISVTSFRIAVDRNYVKAGGDPLVSIVQLAPIRVRFSVSNREVLDVFGGDVSSRRNAAEVSVTLANGSALAERGEIEYAENAADFVGGLFG